MEPKFIPYHVLETITDDFSEETKIGEGGFGTVYKGMYENVEVAVKKLSTNLLHVSDQSFEQEIVNMSKLRHENIVQLIGYCYQSVKKPLEHGGRLIFPEEIERLLCFEYIQNGSLQKYLSEECDKLDWHTTYKIIKGTCEGLRYLHEECTMLHLDLKPDNILLDKDMVAKLADFGLSKFVKDKHTMIVTTKMGTLGFMPPEYLDHNKLSPKFDIFSLGVVIIKTVTGPKTEISEIEYVPPEEFIEQAEAKWRSKLQETCSDSLLEAYCKQVKKCIEIASYCMKNNRNERPTIVEIINKMNETEVEIDKLRPAVDEEPLCFNPTEIHFPIFHNNCAQERIRPLQLINKNESYVASKIIPPRNTLATQLLLVVPPKSKFTVFLTPDLSRTTTDIMDTDNFYVHSTKINKGTNVTDELFTGAAANSVEKAVIKFVYLRDEEPAFPIVQPGINIKFPVEILDLSLMTLQLHPTQPWVLCLCSKNNRRSLQIYNFEKKEWLLIEVVSFDTVKFLGANKLGIVASYGGGVIEIYNFTKHTPFTSFTSFSIFLLSRTGAPLKLTPLKLKRIHSFQAHSHAIGSLAIPPNGQNLLTSDVRGEIRFWDDNWSLVLQFNGHSDAVTEVKFNPDQYNIFASASKDCKVKIWNLSSRRPDAVLVGHSSEVTCLDFVTGKSWLISGSNDKTVKVWDYQTKVCLRTLEDTHSIRAISSHPMMPLIFSGLDDGTIRLWNSTTFIIENSIASYKGGVCAIDRMGTVRVAIGCQGLIIILDTNGR